jgi:hypothetical protein
MQLRSAPSSHMGSEWQAAHAPISQTAIKCLACSLSRAWCEVDLALMRGAPAPLVAPIVAALEDHPLPNFRESGMT